MVLLLSYYTPASRSTRLLFCCSGICILYTRSLDPVSFSAQLERSNAQHLFLPASLRLLLAGLAFYLCSDLCEEVGIGMKLVLVVVLVSNVRRSLCALTCVSHESILWWCHTRYSRDTLSKQHQLSTLTLPLLHSTLNVEHSTSSSLSSTVTRFLEFRFPYSSHADHSPRLRSFLHRKYTRNQKRTTISPLFDTYTRQARLSQLHCSTLCMSRSRRMYF